MPRLWAAVLVLNCTAPHYTARPSTALYSTSNTLPFRKTRRPTIYDTTLECPVFCHRCTCSLFFIKSSFHTWSHNAFPVGLPSKISIFRLPPLRETLPLLLLSENPQTELAQLHNTTSATNRNITTR
jgi:hypothetical protein